MQSEIEILKAEHGQELLRQADRFESRHQDLQKQCEKLEKCAVDLQDEIDKLKQKKAQLERDSNKDWARFSAQAEAAEETNKRKHHDLEKEKTDLEVKCRQLEKSRTI